MTKKIKHCLVKGCKNSSDKGTFTGDLCSPCHEMITTGKVHPNNRTFIGMIIRQLQQMHEQKHELEELIERQRVIGDPRIRVEVPTE